MNHKLICLTVIVILSITACSRGFQSERPNVIIIYTDDQGTLDLNIYGAKDLVTPNLDSLVRDGIMFTQFYAQALCSPSRASLLTGRTPQRAGVPNNVVGTTGLSTDVYSMSRMFKDAGYSTALIGKWHLGEVEGKLPNDHGFEYFFGHLKGCIDSYSHFFYWRGPNTHNLYRNKVEVHYPGEFFANIMLRESEKFIDSNKEDPFFLYFSVNIPHYPYQGKVEWLEYYRNEGVKYPRDQYAAFVSTLDDIIGELISILDKRGIRDNTIIIYQSDNGHSTEERAHFGGGYSGIYRGAKGCFFEGGIRVPATISWPARIPEGQVRDQFAVNADWMPTLAELCQIQINTNELDGKSLIDVIFNVNADSPHEATGYCWNSGKTWAMRKGKWKLHRNPVDTGVPGSTSLGIDLFLVNLEDDPGEKYNVADQYPDMVKELEEEYQKWQERTKPQDKD